MASFHVSLLLIATIATRCLAQGPAAPAPAPPGPLNLTAILVKAGQYTTFIKLLASTQAGTQINNQANSSTEGMTVFAPTDNAFQNLKAGALNGLTDQQQVQLVLNHVLSKFYTLDQFQTVSNPVRTEATGQEGGVFGLNITSMGNNQVNVSTGDISTPVNNPLRQKFPLAVYQVDKVLMPKFGSTKATSADGPAPAAKPKADGPSAPADDEGKKNGGVGVRSMGVGVVMGFGLVTLSFLS